MDSSGRLGPLKDSTLLVPSRSGEGFIPIMNWSGNCYYSFAESETSAAAVSAAGDVTPVAPVPAGTSFRRIDGRGVVIKP